MAFRGRGRGRGRGGHSDMRIAKHVPYEDFPEDVSLPSLPSIASLTDEMKALIRRKARLEDFWRSSCYHLQEAAPKSKSQDAEIEQFSDRKKKTQAKREALASYLKLTPSNFPVELIQGSMRVQHDNKRLRWDRDSDEKTFDLFGKLEEKYKGQDGKVGKKDENEDDNEGQEEVEEESSDGEFDHNIEFDDDEDDMNMEEGEEEDVYDI